jgi:hypothetical protein
LIRGFVPLELLENGVSQAVEAGGHLPGSRFQTIRRGHGGQMVPGRETGSAFRLRPHEPAFEVPVNQRRRVVANQGFLNRVGPFAAPANRPWWSLSSNEKKKQIEQAVEWHLSQDFELSNIQIMLLRDAIGYTYSGLFGVAAQALSDMNLPGNAWAISDNAAAKMIEGIDRSKLWRMLNSLKASEAQCSRIFC